MKITYQKLVAEDMESDVPKVLKELGTQTTIGVAPAYLLSRSATLRGAKLALEPDEFVRFVTLVREASKINPGDTQ